MNVLMTRFIEKARIRSRRNVCLFALLLLLGLGTSGTFGAVQLSIGSNTGSPGSTVSVPSSLSSDTNVVAVQYDVLFNSTNLNSDAPVAGNAQAGSVIASSLLNPGTRRVVLYSPANAALTNGILANLLFSIATNAPAGVSSLTLTNVIFANAQAGRVQSPTLVPGIVTVSLTAPARFGTILLSTNGAVQFNVLGADNLAYVIQTSTNLMQWVDLSTNVVTGGAINFTDTNVSHFRYRFYRVRTGP
jgi:hypothetical protein